MPAGGGGIEDPVQPGSDVAGALGGGGLPDLSGVLDALQGVVQQLQAVLGAGTLGSGPGTGMGTSTMPSGTFSDADLQTLRADIEMTNHASTVQEHLVASMGRTLGAIVPSGSSGAAPLPVGDLPAPVAGMSTFAQVEQERSSVDLLPGAANTAANLTRIADARNQRTSRLHAALQRDLDARGTMDPVDAQKLSLEVQTMRHTYGLAQRVAQFGGALTEGESATLLQLANEANGDGIYSASKVGGALFAIEARLGGYPPTSTQSGQQAFAFLASREDALQAHSRQVADAATATGTFDQAGLDSLLAQGRAIEAATTVLQGVLQQARQDPAAASQLGARLDAAVAAGQQGGAAAFAAALG